MAFTDHSDIFGSVGEEGVNRLVQHVIRQRPSLFNYATAAIAANPELWCEPIEVAPDVRNFGNPFFTIEDPLPVLGTNGVYSVNFIFQVTRLEVDFHPGNVFGLPPELAPPLGAQRYALHARICAGLGCPPKEILDHLEPPPDQKEHYAIADVPKRHPPVVLPTRELECFCLDLYLLGRFQVEGPKGSQRLVGKIDGLEIVDIAPKKLENSLECYLRLLVQLVILPRLSAAVSQLMAPPLRILDLATITLSFTPTSPALPNNPAIEGNQLKVFIDFEVAP